MAIASSVKRVEGDRVQRLKGDRLMEQAVGSLSAARDRSQEIACVRRFRTLPAGYGPPPTVAGTSSRISLQGNATTGGGRPTHGNRAAYRDRDGIHRRSHRDCGTVTTAAQHHRTLP